MCGPPRRTSPASKRTLFFINGNFVCYQRNSVINGTLFVINATLFVINGTLFVIISLIVNHNYVQLLRPMHPDCQSQFNIGRARRSGDESDRAAHLLRILATQLTQRIGYRQHHMTRVDDGDVHRRQKRNQPVPLTFGHQDQRAGFGNRRLRRCDPDIVVEEVVRRRTNIDFT